MAKKGPLGKAEKHYIEDKCYTQSSKQTANDLDRTIEIVEKYANEYKIMKTKAGGKFARHGEPGNPKTSTAVVSTQAASERSDDFRKESRKKTRREKGCTVKIKPDA